MIAVPLAALLTGSALGLIFRVWILLPASFAAMAIIMIFGWGAGSALQMVWQVVLTMLALQAGYGLGLASRHLTVVVRARSIHRAIRSAKRARLERA